LIKHHSLVTRALQQRREQRGTRNWLRDSPGIRTNRDNIAILGHLKTPGGTDWSRRWSRAALLYWMTPAWSALLPVDLLLACAWIWRVRSEGTQRESTTSHRH